MQTAELWPEMISRAGRPLQRVANFVSRVMVQPGSKIGERRCRDASSSASALGPDHDHIHNHVARHSLLCVRSATDFGRCSVWVAKYGSSGLRFATCSLGKGGGAAAGSHPVICRSWWSTCHAASLESHFQGEICNARGAVGQRCCGRPALLWKASIAGTPWT